MKPALQLRLHQQLALTPQLQLAIRLLQLSHLELEAELRSLAEANPLLEFAEDAEAEGEIDDAPAAPSDYASSAEGVPDSGDNDANGDDPAEWADASDLTTETPIDFSSASNASNGTRNDEDFEPQNAAPETLQQHLLWQLNLSGFDPRQTAIATVLIDALDDDGYLLDGLPALPPDLRATPADVEAVRLRLQAFDPPGVASLDLRDCLRSQLDQFDTDTPQRELAVRIVEDELELLARNDLARLAHKLRASEADAATAAALIRGLDPRPGAAFDAAPVEYVAPDVWAVKERGHWQVRLNPDAQPQLRLNEHYCNLIGRTRGDDANWMKGQLQEARWLLKSLEARGETLLKVMRCLLKVQSGFLEFGEQALRPLTLREIAGEVGLHESTVSRAIARKYARTPRGTLPLKAFFASGIDTEGGGEASSTAIQSMIRRLIDAENPRKPLSDAKLAELLKQSGVPVARRTVAKYREAMNFPASHERVRIA